MLTPREYEVRVDRATGADGVVLVDRIESFDWVTRRADPIGRVHQSVMAAVRELLKALLAVA